MWYWNVLECAKYRYNFYFFAKKKEKKKYSSKLYPFILCPKKDLLIGLYIDLKLRLKWLCHSLTPVAEFLSSSLCLWDSAPFLIQCWMVWVPIRYFMKSNTEQSALVHSRNHSVDAISGRSGEISTHILQSHLGLFGNVKLPGSLFFLWKHWAKYSPELFSQQAPGLGPQLCFFLNKHLASGLDCGRADNDVRINGVGGLLLLAS